MATVMPLQAAATRKISTATSRDLDDYRNFFNCLICIDAAPPIRPRLLTCGHVFCEDCLRAQQQGLRGHGLVTFDLMGGGNAFIKCPTCRQVTVASSDGSLGERQILGTGVDGYRSTGARKVSVASETSQRCDACIHRQRCESADFYCSKCSMNYCIHCRSSHDQHPLFKDHTVIHISSKDTFNLCCETHGRMDCLYFCFDCDHPCCTVCMLQEQHRNHSAARLREALASRRDSLKTLLNLFAPKQAWLEAKVKRVSSMMSSKDNTYMRHNSSMTSSVSDLPSTSSDYSSNVSVDTADLMSCKPSYWLSNGEITKEVPPCNKSCRSVSNEDIVKMASCYDPTSEDAYMIGQIMCRSERITKLFMLATNLLEQSQSKKLLAVYTDVVSRIKVVLDSEMLDLQKVLDEISARSSLIGRQTSNYLHRHPSTSSDAESSPCSEPSEGRTRHGSGASETSSKFTDEQEGPLRSMLVRPKLLWKVEKQRADQGELWNPCGAAFLPNRGLIVAEYDVTNNKNNKLRVFDAAGQSTNVLANGQIQPLGVTVTKEENIAVTDCRGKRVKILSLSGHSIIDIGKNQLSWPYGITTTSRGQLVVTDAFADCVSIYSVEGKRIRQFGSSGSANTQFRNPYHVAVDSYDNIYVSDSGNNCVKVFDINGKYIFTAAETGIRRSGSDALLASYSPSVSSSTFSFSPSILSSSVRHKMDSVSSDTPLLRNGGSRTRSVQGLAGGGKLKRRRLKNPRGVTVDLKGNILVADDCCRVCMFDATGRYVRHLLTDEDLVRYPEVVSCSKDGLLVITEWNPNNMFAVKVFTLYEQASN